MLVVNRFKVPGEGGTGDERDPVGVPDLATDPFPARARRALEAFAACRGFVDGRLGRAADDPTWWCLVTVWESVGAYRRALSSYDVKLHAAPMLSESVPEPSAYEVLAVTDGGPIREAGSDRAVPAGDYHRDQ